MVASANKIQIKRSTANGVVTGLANGELAFTQASNTLWIGLPDGSGVVSIAGERNPGTLTANQALVANSTSGIDKVIVANLNVQKVYANGAVGNAGFVLASGAGANAYWVDPGTFSTSAAGSNTYVQFNNSGAFGATANLTFDSGTSTLYTPNINVGTIYFSGSGESINSTTYTGTTNNATYAFGKSEGDLNVNNATTSDTANNATYAFGKSEGDLNVNNAITSDTANNATYAFGKSEGDLNVNSASTAVDANNATYLGSNTVADIVTLAVANTQSNNNTFTGNNIFQGNTDFQGQIANNFIPTANNTYSLGNSSMRWANLYLSGSTIVLGNSNISDTANGVTIDNFESTSNAFFANVQISSYIVSNATPGTNTTYYLGTSSNWWANAFIGGITANTGSFTGDVTVGRNLIVSGNVTTQNVQSIIVSDPLIFLAGNNTSSDMLDIGFAGQYYDGGNERWTGLYRDHADSGIYKLFTNTLQNLLSNNDIDPTYSGYQTATLQTYLLSGGLVANASNVQITANGTYGVSIVANTLTLTSALNSNSGGTGQSSYTAGDLLYANGTYSVAKLGVGANGEVLQIVNNLPAYGSLDGGTF